VSFWALWVFVFGMYMVGRLVGAYVGKQKVLRTIRQMHELPPMVIHRLRTYDDPKAREEYIKSLAKFGENE
jgi:hypothetical protein